MLGLLVVAGLGTGCSSLLYFPTDLRYIKVENLNPKPQEFSVGKYQKHDVMAWFFEAPQINRKAVSVVMFHGNGQNMSAHFKALYWLVGHGYNLLVFDYPGYGINNGKPNPDSTVESGKLALHWIIKRHPKDKIVIYGQSLGGNVALRTISEFAPNNTCAAVIESSFLSYKKVASYTLSKSWLTWLFQPLAWILISDSRAISSHLDQLPTSIPYVIIHGTDDPIVPYSMGQKLYDKISAQKKQFWSVPGGHHIDTYFHHPEFRPRLLQLLKEDCL